MIIFLSEGNVVDGAEYPEVQVALSGDAGLESVISAFESFLRASGFVFDGSLVLEQEIIPNNEVN